MQAKVKATATENMRACVRRAVVEGVLLASRCSGMDHGDRNMGSPNKVNGPTVIKSGTGT